jgi:hypothetical protein
MNARVPQSPATAKHSRDQQSSSVRPIVVRKDTSRIIPLVLATDSHALPELRVNGPGVEHAEFAQAFACKAAKRWCGRTGAKFGDGQAVLPHELTAPLASPLPTSWVATAAEPCEPA